MMSQQIGFSILTAPLASIDRRALSQAWYSALQLAHDRATSGPRARIKGRCSDDATRIASPMHRANASPKSAALTRVVKHSEAEPKIGSGSERRAARSALARKIERTFLHPSAPSTRATFSIGATRERVHIALHVRGRGVRLVAICAPRVRARVARALMEARYALAQRGVALDLRGAPQCW